MAKQRAKTEKNREQKKKQGEEKRHGTAKTRSRARGPLVSPADRAITRKRAAVKRSLTPGYAPRVCARRDSHIWVLDGLNRYVATVRDCRRRFTPHSPTKFYCSDRCTYLANYARTGDAMGPALARLLNLP